MRTRSPKRKWQKKLKKYDEKLRRRERRTEKQEMNLNIIKKEENYRYFMKKEKNITKKAINKYFLINCLNKTYLK